MAAELAIGLIILIIAIIAAVVIGLVLLLIFWIFMIVDAAKRNFKNESEKIAWILVVVLVGWLGAVIYYFAIKKPNKH